MKINLNFANISAAFKHVILENNIYTLRSVKLIFLYYNETFTFAKPIARVCFGGTIGHWFSGGRFQGLFHKREPHCRHQINLVQE